MSKRADNYFSGGGPSGHGLEITPYRECSFRCVYCVASTQGQSTPWYGRHEVLEHLRQALRGLPADQPVGLAPCTDPYPPIEETERVTRLILEELHRTGRPYKIVTKGTLVTRDIDILSDYSVDHEVWMVLGALDEKVLAAIEPGAPPPAARLAAIHQLAAAGIRVTVNAAPRIPEVTDADALVSAMPASARIFMCPMYVGHTGGAITLLGRTWTQSELMIEFRAARDRFTPRPNVEWLAAEYDKTSPV